MELKGSKLRQLCPTGSDRLSKSFETADARIQDASIGWFQFVNRFVLAHRRNDRPDNK